MKTVIIIPCCKEKSKEPCKAEKMYKSQMFRMRLKYAKQFRGDIYILSAKYGLVSSNTVIEPYNLSLKEFSKKKKIEWSVNVVNKLKTLCSLEEDKFIILAGKFYIEYILPAIKNYELPLSFCDDKMIGLKMKWLKEHIQEEYLLF